MKDAVFNAVENPDRNDTYTGNEALSAARSQNVPERVDNLVLLVSWYLFFFF
ncbi:unnamed protein product [Ixodes pacificus]